MVDQSAIRAANTMACISLVMLLGGLLVTDAVTAVTACRTAFDCSLSGECVDGACQCYAGWKGADCGALDLLPAPIAGAPGWAPTGTKTTWGGTAMYGAEDGKYHMLATYADAEGSHVWNCFGAIAHAIADTAGGPFTFTHTVLAANGTDAGKKGGAFVGNPILQRAPDGTYVLFYSLTRCNASAVTFPWSGDLRVASAPRLEGPWTPRPRPILAAALKLDGPYPTNPAAHVYANGSVLFAYRGWHDFLHQLAAAPSWRGPYTRRPGQVFRAENDEPGTTFRSMEDPFVWVDARTGAHHMLLHNQWWNATTDFAGAHAFSRDGVTWALSATPAYARSIANCDGTATALTRREEPKLVMGADGVTPRYLLNAVVPASNTSYAYVSAVEIRGNNASSSAPVKCAAAAARAKNRNPAAAAAEAAAAVRGNGSNPSNKCVRWKLPTGANVDARPVVHDGTVFVGSQDAFFRAIDAASGAVRWRFKTGGMVVSSAAIAAGTNGSAAAVFGSGDGFVYALDAASGALRFRTRTGGAVTSSPAVHGGAVFVGSNDGAVYALSAATGAVAWRHATGGPVRASPLVLPAEGLVVVGGDDAVVRALDARSGAERWRVRAGDRVQSSAALHAAENLVLFGSDDFSVYAVDAASGRVRWTFATAWSVRASPAAGADAVFVASTDFSIYALSAASGEQLWSFQSTNTMWSSPAVDAGVVYAASNDAHLYALDERTGALRWSYKTGMSVQASPLLSNGTCFLGSYDFHVYAFDVAACGKEWRSVTFRGHRKP